MIRLIDWFLCRVVGYCRRCRLLETATGIGGQCVSCGRIHGWMTTEELRELWERSR